MAGEGFSSGFAQYVGIPWVPNGESRWGADCWGLVRLVLKTEAGVLITHPSAMPADAARVSARHFAEVKELVLGDVRLVPVTPPYSDLDILEIEVRGPGADHIGIIAGGALLHSLRGIGSHRTPLKRLKPGSIAGAWRISAAEGKGLV